MEYYICPTCKTENEDYVKYCKRCGTWLLSDTFPAKKVQKTKKRSNVGKILFSVIILVLIAIGVFRLVFSPLVVTFDSIDIGEQYTIKQLELKDSLLGAPSVVTDITAHATTNNPLNLIAVFYDEKEMRLGRAVGMITQQLLNGQTTTVNLKIDSNFNIKEVRSVRIEIAPVTPLETIKNFIE